MTTQPDKPKLFAEYSPRPIFGERTNGYAGGNDDSKLAKKAPAKRRRTARPKAPKGLSPTALTVFGIGGAW